MDQMSKQARDLALGLADELCVTYVSITPDWSDKPTAWAGVTNRDGSGEEVFRVSVDADRINLSVHGVGQFVRDCVDQFPDLLVWVQYARRAYKVSA